MSDLIAVQGVVLSSMPVGDYDRRVVLLTKERGKIAAFAKGARRPNSPFMAAANPFVFGTFTLYEGKSSYTLNHVEIGYHFAELAARQPAVYYGYYFLELADYFGREGIDETETMNLLFMTVKALLNETIDNRLVRCIYELRLLTIQGLMPRLYECTSCGKEVPGETGAWFSFAGHGVMDEACARLEPEARRLSPQTLYTMKYIVSMPLNKIYTFTIKKDYLTELEYVVYNYTRRNTDKRFKSLEILDFMCSGT